MLSGIDEDPVEAMWWLVRPDVFEPEAEAASPAEAAETGSFGILTWPSIDMTLLLRLS